MQVSNIVSLEKLKELIQIPAVRHLFLGACVFLAAIVIQHRTYSYGENKANYKLMRFLKYAAIFPDSIATIKSDHREVLLEKSISNPKDSKEVFRYVTVSLPIVTNCKVNRMYQQLTDVALKAHNHLMVAKEFMVQSYVCTSTSAIFFIIAGICVAFITKSGFAQANPYFITLLICSVAVGSFFLGLTNIFKQEENANRNLALYLKYINLEQHIRTHLVTDKYILLYANTPCDTVSALNKTIIAIDQEMKTINEVSIGFNSQGVKALTSFGIDDKFNITQ